MPGPRLKVGQVWVNEASFYRDQKDREYHIITSIGTPRNVWGISVEKKVLATRFFRGQVIQENSWFTSADANDMSLDNLVGWTLVTSKGMAGLQKKLRAAIKKAKRPIVYRRTLKKAYRDRLIAEALTGTKPIA